MIGIFMLVQNYILAKDSTAFINHKGHQLQFEDMIEAIQIDREPEVNGYEGRKSVAIISAIYPQGLF